MTQGCRRDRAVRVVEAGACRESAMHEVSVRHATGCALRGDSHRAPTVADATAAVDATRTAILLHRRTPTLASCPTYRYHKGTCEQRMERPRHDGAERSCGRGRRK